MKAKELIAELSKLDPETEIFVRDGVGDYCETMEFGEVWFNPSNMYDVSYFSSERRHEKGVVIG